MPSIQEVEQRLIKFRRELPLLIGNVVVNFALDNFDQQGFQTGAGVDKWPDRKDKSRKGAILVGKQSGRLRRSIKVIRHDANSVTVGSDVPYSGIHNEGGTLLVPITARSRKFFWAMYYALSKPKGKGKRIENQEALKWKYMALTNKSQLRIQMPERRFIGNSEELNRRIARMIERRIEAIFNS